MFIVDTILVVMLTEATSNGFPKPLPSMGDAGRDPRGVCMIRVVAVRWFLTRPTSIGLPVPQT